MSLEKRLFKQLNLIGNFNNEVVQLGKIYQIDDGDFTPLGYLNEFDSSINMDAIIEHSAPVNREIKTSSDVNLNLKASATSPIGEDEVEVVVGSKRNGIIMLKDCVTATLKSQLVKPKIIQIWKDQKFDRNPMRFCFVTELLEPASGTVLISQDKNSRIVLGHDGPITVGAVPVLLNGKVTVNATSGIVSHIISSNPFQPLWSGLRLKSNEMFEKLG